MARHLLCSVCLIAVAAALALPACDRPASLTSDGESARPIAGRAAEAGFGPPRSHAALVSTSSRNSSVASALDARPQAEETPAWLVELLHAPDPEVRIQALDAWTRQPGSSLDPVTYALVDPDESVRARAQQILEEELSRR